MHEATGLLALLTALEPHLTAEVRKESQALRNLLTLFPGQPLADVERSVRTILASSRTTLPALAERCRAAVGGAATESNDELMKDVGRLAAGDLKKLGQALDLELTAKTKTANLAALRQWLDSGGAIKPVGAAELAEQQAREFAGELPELMKRLDADIARQVIERIDAAAKMKKEVFVAFARLLGLTVSGTGPQMRKQLKDFVNRLAVSHSQTQF